MTDPNALARHHNANLRDTDCRDGDSLCRKKLGSTNGGNQ